MPKWSLFSHLSVRFFWLLCVVTAPIHSRALEASPDSRVSLSLIESMRRVYEQRHAIDDFFWPFRDIEEKSYGSGSKLATDTREWPNAALMSVVVAGLVNARLMDLDQGVRRIEKSGARAEVRFINHLNRRAILALEYENSSVGINGLSIGEGLGALMLRSDSAPDVLRSLEEAREYLLPSSAPVRSEGNVNWTELLTVSTYLRDKYVQTHENVYLAWLRSLALAHGTAKYLWLQYLLADAVSGFPLLADLQEAMRLAKDRDASTLLFALRKLESENYKVLSQSSLAVDVALWPDEAVEAIVIVGLANGGHLEIQDAAERARRLGVEVTIQNVGSRRVITRVRHDSKEVRLTGASVSEALSILMSRTDGRRDEALAASLELTRDYYWGKSDDLKGKELANWSARIMVATYFYDQAVIGNSPDALKQLFDLYIASSLTRNPSSSTIAIALLLGDAVPRVIQSETQRAEWYQYTVGRRTLGGDCSKNLSH